MVIESAKLSRRELLETIAQRGTQILGVSTLSSLAANCTSREDFTFKGKLLGDDATLSPGFLPPFTDSTLRVTRPNGVNIVYTLELQGSYTSGYKFVVRSVEIIENGTTKTYRKNLDGEEVLRAAMNQVSRYLSAISYQKRQASRPEQDKAVRKLYNIY